MSSGYPVNALDGNGVPLNSSASSDGSVNITSGGVAQTLVAADATRVTLNVFNPHGSENLWIAINGITAAANGLGSLCLGPLQGASFTGGEAKTAVSIVAATTGHPVTVSVGH